MSSCFLTLPPNSWWHFFSSGFISLKTSIFNIDFILCQQFPLNVEHWAFKQDLALFKLMILDTTKLSARYPPQLTARGLPTCAVFSLVKASGLF